jgi:hypothetical protein
MHRCNQQAMTTQKVEYLARLMYRDKTTGARKEKSKSAIKNVTSYKGKTVQRREVPLTAIIPSNPAMNKLFSSVTGALGRSQFSTNARQAFENLLTK